jgi:hypothetical protein
VETTGIECFHGVARIPHFLGISHSERPLNEENKSNEKLDEVFDEAFDWWKAKHDCCVVVLLMFLEGGIVDAIKPYMRL